MKNLVKHVQNTNAQESLWKSGDFVVIGVSGGSDSVCLLDVLSKIAQKEGLHLVVAHVNYGLRSTSDDDEKFVKTLAEKYAIPFYSTRTPRSLASTENAWRDFRHSYFKSITDKYKDEGDSNVHVALAHNQNDQAETVLLHLLRGSGLQGLSAMRVKGFGIVRPLLNVQKEDILAYLEEKSLTYCTDQTNDDQKYTRNKVRHTLIPLLEKEFNGNIVKTLSDTARVVGEDYAFIDQSVHLFWNCDDGLVTFDKNIFSTLSQSEKRHSILKMINYIKKDPKNISLDLVDEVCHMIESPKNKHKIKTFLDLMISVKGAKVEITLNREKPYK